MRAMAPRVEKNIIFLLRLHIICCIFVSVDGVFHIIDKKIITQPASIINSHVPGYCPSYNYQVDCVPVKTLKRFLLHLHFRTFTFYLFDNYKTNPLQKHEHQARQENNFIRNKQHYNIKLTINKYIH